MSTNLTMFVYGKIPDLMVNFGQKSRFFQLSHQTPSDVTERILALPNADRGRAYISWIRSRGLDVTLETSKIERVHTFSCLIGRGIDWVGT